MKPSAGESALAHEQIMLRLRQRIGREWKPGYRLPPIGKLAREMGVGETNAYRAVRELRRQGLLASRPRQGTIVTTRRVSAIRGTRRRLVYFPLSADRDAMINRMATAFIEELGRRGCEVKAESVISEHQRQLDLRSLDVDAVVLCNFNESIDVKFRPEQLFSFIDTTGRPTVKVSGRYDVVGPDNEQGGMLAGECMRRFGMADAAFVGVRSRISGAYCEVDAERLAGFERGFGRTLSPVRRLYVDSYSEIEGAGLVRTFMRMRPRPQAIFASTDEIAAGFVIGGTVMNLHARRDYTIIGFDGQSLGRFALNGGITTVAVPAEAMGRQAAEFLDMRFRRPDLPPRSISLGCAIRRGRTTPSPTASEHPFSGNVQYWPATLDLPTITGQ